MKGVHHSNNLYLMVNVNLISKYLDGLWFREVCLNYLLTFKKHLKVKQLYFIKKKS